MRVVEDLDEIIFNLEVMLRAAKDSPQPRLLVNANALVVEYNDAATNAKIFEKVATLIEK